ncbi:MAG: thiamine-binding protein [Actinomycetota bacterium]
MADNITVEFTIEPFVDGALPAYVTAAVEALEAMGITAVVGPFGTAVTATPAQVGPAVGAVLAAAYANGATHVSIDSGRL